MRRPAQINRTLGNWSVGFRSRGARLSLRHEPTGWRVSGALQFHALDRRGMRSFDNWDGPWAIRPTWPGEAYPLGLIAPGGECQAYLAFVADGNRFELRIINRPRQVFAGQLTFSGACAARAGAFACRTDEAAPTRVLQMASGPADSTLNDSIFDMRRDRLVRLSPAQRARILTQAESGRPPRFAIETSTVSGRAGGDGALGFEIVENYYRDRWVPHYRTIDKKRLPSAPTGWMSWNTWFDQAGERENLAEARTGARHLKPYGLEIWSIESWQEKSDHQPVRAFHNLTMRAHAEQFPHGMAWLSRQIRKLGFQPGIWTVPFGTGSRAFYEAHRDWFLHHPDGRPMENWAGLYVLDPSQPRVRRFMRETHRRMAEQWDYDFFKIDGISGYDSSYSAHFYEKPEVRAAFRNQCDEPMRLCMEALRKGIGPKRTLLACQGHHTGPEVAVCDATRIGSDIVGIEKPPMWHNYHDQALRTQALLFCHNIVWYSDPDTLLVGEAASLDTARLATTVVALPGQMMFAGDRLDRLAPERMWLLQRSLPVCGARPLDLFPVYDLKDVWALKVRRDFGQWDVVSLFNYTERAANRKVAFGELGLDPLAEYLVYDFWAAKFLGRKKRYVEARVPARGNVLLAVHRAEDRPQFLSTDRHVTQGGTSIEALHWDSATGELTGTVRLVPCETSTLTIHVPEGWRLKKATARGARIATQAESARILRVRLSPQGRNRAAEWQVVFGKSVAK